jgi:hypothetical protein
LHTERDRRERVDSSSKLAFATPEQFPRLFILRVCYYSHHSFHQRDPSIKTKSNPLESSPRKIVDDEKFGEGKTVEIETSPPSAEPSKAITSP